MMMSVVPAPNSPTGWLSINVLPCRVVFLVKPMNTELNEI